AAPILRRQRALGVLTMVHGSAAGEQLRIAAVEPRLRLATDAVALLSSERLLIFVRSRYSQAEPGPLRHQVPIGARWRVRRVRSERLRSWELVEGPEGRRLVAAWRDRAVAGTEIVWSAELPFDSLPATLRLPELRFMPEEDGTRLEETVHWVIAAGDELDLVAERTLHHEPIALESAPAWVTLPEESSYRFAWRSRRPDALLEVRPRARSSRLAATIVSFARLGEEFLHVNNRIGFRVRSAGRDRFHLRLPPGAELVSLELQNQRSQVIGTGDDGTDITIELTSPQRGEHEVDLLYRMPAGAGVDDSAPPMVLPIVIFDGERRLAEVDQYVGVVQTERTFTLETRATGLSPVEAETFPLLPEEISPRSLRPSWRATALDWSLTLREQEIEAAEGLDAVIPLADLSTRIGGDGTLRTRVTYTLINERLQFLSVELPEGADLWGVTVNGRPVAVGQESGATGAARTLRIPVDQEGGSELALEVALTYEEPPVDLPGMHAVSRLAAPRIPEEQKVQVVQSIWSVQFPEGYEVAERAGRMRQAPPSLRHAEKLKNLLEQQEVIIEAASGYESRRAQARAARQLARIEQELGDNLAGLRSSNRSPTELMQRALIGKRELGQQWLQNDQIIEETRKAQGRLREELEKGKAQQGAGASRDEQAFRDRANFLRGRAWRGGKQAAQGGDGAVPRGRPGAAGERRRGRSGEPRHSALDGLLEEHAYRGWNALALAAMAPEAETAAPAPIDAKGGLKPLPDAARAGAAPAFKPAEAPEGTTTYTWRRGDAAAELTLSFTRQGTWSRTGAWLLLILVCGGYAWRRWRSQRTGTGYFRARA
ncbi:MAG: hypothetical protein ACE5GW_11420, partial [Planctomycetota bacterium]